MITIRIEGPRGAGKTTTAMAIVQHLQALGQDVTYRGYSHDQEELVAEDLEHFVPLPAMHSRQGFTVIDG
jgi:thymidylate kinase